MVVLLVVLACIVAVAGFLSLSEATSGVGILATACLLAILARIAQASSQHAALMRAILPPQPRRPMGEAERIEAAARDAVERLQR